MPANVKSIENMTKNLTNAEKQSRAAQEARFARDTVRLTPPNRLRKDKPAMEYWSRTIRKMRGISLLDDVDTDMLAVYCECMARRDMLNDLLLNTPPVMDENTLKAVQAQERLIHQYAEKLGLTPAGRARLAKKKAEERTIDPSLGMFGG